MRAKVVTTPKSLVGHSPFEDLHVCSIVAGLLQCCEFCFANNELAAGYG